MEDEDFGWIALKKRRQLEEPCGWQAVQLEPCDRCARPRKQRNDRCQRARVPDVHARQVDHRLARQALLCERNRRLPGEPNVTGALATREKVQEREETSVITLGKGDGGSEIGEGQDARGVAGGSAQRQACPGCRRDGQRRRAQSEEKKQKASQPVW